MAADKRGGNKTVRDLILSMLVLGLVVYAIYLFIPHGSKGSPVKAETVGYSVELQQARRDAPYQILGPERLGPQWRATSVTYTGTDRRNVTWHLGFIDPEQQYAALEQSNGDPSAFISGVTLGAHRDAGRTITAGGVTWNYYTGGRYHALVREQKGTTTVVLGTAPDAQLTRLATSLRG